MHHAEYIEKQRLKVAKIASNVLKGEQSILTAAREIVSLKSELNIDENDDDMLVFILIDSETDHLPVGPEKEHWDPNALLDKQKEIQKSEKWALSFGLDACQRLFERFSHD
jgi:hypothetical protein